MDRKIVTKFLGNLLKADKLSGPGKYWASEVTIDWATFNTKRVDFMLFSPEDQCSVSGLEKGIFTCYEIKSCKADVYSGKGLNFLGEKNYIVTTRKHLIECFPESSFYYGFIVAVPTFRDEKLEFDNPTPIPADGRTDGWKLKIIAPCRPGLRTRSMTELLFCMLRSGH